jgi:glycosyltransferase involved in cell wall biosynthesis
MLRPDNKVQTDKHKNKTMVPNGDLWVLHICHCHYPPFLDVARQYNSLFIGTEYKTLTVYITGEASKEIEDKTCSDEVIFMEFSSKQVSGLKLSAINKVKEILATRNFIFCITHRTKPTYIALLATKLPVVSVHHNYGDFKRFTRRVFFNLFKSRLLLLGVSDSVRDEMRSIFNKWPRTHIETLYNRVDVSKIKGSLLSKTAARLELGINQNAWVVGCVARLHPIKDHVTLIKGFASALPSLSDESILVIMGSGEMESDLKLLVKSLEIQNNVVFTGFKDNARVYFKAFDVFALASKREAFGMVFIEAMTAGLQIISSENGGGAEVVRGVGEVFNVGDFQALAQKIIKTQKITGKFDTNVDTTKLSNYFSDDAVKNYFWKLPFVMAVTKG